jgi:LysR family transcriptional activator of glutamate synthase operon
VVVHACHAHGFTPAIETTGDSLIAQLTLVAAGLGVCVQPAPNATLTRTDVVTVPIRRTELSSALHVAHHRWHRSPAVEAFLRCLPPS